MNARYGSTSRTQRSGSAQRTEAEHAPDLIGVLRARRAARPRCAPLMQQYAARPNVARTGHASILNLMRVCAGSGRCSVTCGECAPRRNEHTKRPRSCGRSQRTRSRLRKHTPSRSEHQYATVSARSLLELVGASAPRSPRRKRHEDQRCRRYDASYPDPPPTKLVGSTRPEGRIIGYNR